MIIRLIKVNHYILISHNHFLQYNYNKQYNKMSKEVYQLRIQKKPYKILKHRNLKKKNNKLK